MQHKIVSEPEHYYFSSAKNYTDLKSAIDAEVVFMGQLFTDCKSATSGETLRTTGRWHKKTRDRNSYEFKKYRKPACKECLVKSLCTSRAGGREIDRSQYANAVEENNQCYRDNGQLFRKRQEINEHNFGTIKRQWGYNHTNLTGLEKVNSEHSLIMML